MGGIFPLLPFSVIFKMSATLPLLWLSPWRPCLHLGFPGPPRELGKAKSAGSVPLVFPLSDPAPLPELPLLCMAERLVPLDVRCKLDALEEKELISPRSPEEPPVFEGEISDSHSRHSTTGSSVSCKEEMDTKANRSHNNTMLMCWFENTNDGKKFQFRKVGTRIEFSGIKEMFYILF